MEICRTFNPLSCIWPASHPAKTAKNLEMQDLSPSFDEERALQSLAILKLEQIRGAREGEATGKNIASLLKTYKESLGNKEEAAKNLEGLKELFWHIGIALTELHTHEAGVEDVYEKTVQEALHSIKSQGEIIEEILKEAKFEGMNHELLTKEKLTHIAEFYLALNPQRTVRGAVTLGNLTPENIYFELNPKGFGQLTLVNTESLCSSLNKKGEGTGFAFNDVIQFTHATIEFCIKEEIPLEDIGGMLESYLKGYQLAYKVRLQDYLSRKNVEPSEVESTLRAFAPTLLYPLASLKVMVNVLARNLLDMKELREDDPLYAVKKKLVTNTAYTIHSEIANYRNRLMQQILKIEQELEKEEPQEEPADSQEIE